MPARLDIDALSKAVTGRRVAVVCTPAGWVPGLGPISDYMMDHADVRGFVALEHGLRGDLQDGVQFDTYVDERSGCPVYSMYGKGRALPEELLQSVDVIVFHVQDVSHRAYTFKQAMAETIEAVAGTQVRVVVLDRPTPLGHLGCHGPLYAQYFPEPLPVVISMTLGELALWLVRSRGLDVDLDVIPVRDWHRDMTWPETGLPWIPPSPNVPSLDSVYCYACTGILQRTTISEGRGTCKPFEFFGAPFVDAAGLVHGLTARQLPGVTFRETYFTPAFSKYAGELCAGAHLMVLEPRRVKPLETMFAVLQEFAVHAQGRFDVDNSFSSWLDGTSWDVDRLVDLNVEAYLAAADERTRAFQDAVAGFSPYA